MPLDPLAERAFSTRADHYERARPGWPSAAVELAAAGLGLRSESTVVDLAAGTGKLTRELVGHFARVVAVEPLAEMRRELEATVAGVDALEGTATDIPLGDASADAVFVADAFHWFATADALAEIARVVRPGGGTRCCGTATTFRPSRG
jgi:ubiquinone/menaquinone biosynthesis C-methylase UbiE